jgi:Ca2+:H+ antiporter
MTEKTIMTPRTLGRVAAREWLMLAAALAAVLAYSFEPVLQGSGRTVALATAALLILLIIGASLRASHHAEVIAERLGDPYGTMVLTLSAVIVEVTVLAIMMSHEPSPTLVRDTIYAAVMLDINGILGLAALLGGLKHGEQDYNDDSGKTYGVMILTAMGISMVVPEFIPRANWHIYSAFTIFAMVLLYSLFLRMQVGTHSYFFSYNYRAKREDTPTAVQGHESRNLSIVLLVAGIVVIAAVAEAMSPVLKAGMAGMGMPPIVLGLVVATISACPEILTALRAALANRMQSVVNIAMGASLSTVILTVPIMEAIALFNGTPFQMAMTPVQSVMVVLTLIAAAINLNDGQSNAIEGMTHFVLFATFLMLTFLGL